MLRIALGVLVVLGVGCADSDLDPTAPELHQLGACASGWPSSVGVGNCELPCQDVRPADPEHGVPFVCTARFTGTRGLVQARSCSESMAFDYHGVTGCCGYDYEKADDGSVFVRFAVCDEQ